MKDYGPRGTKPTFRRRWHKQAKASRTSAYDKGGEGTEIVQELLVCPECAEKQAGVEAALEAEALEAEASAEVSAEVSAEASAEVSGGTDADENV